ncbi:MAG TPA: hypothetical protein VGD92_07575 [Sphingobacteriaceae bacterium]
MDYQFLKRITKDETHEYRFSVCTLVTRLTEYHEMVDSFIRAGFDTETCEYLYIDNSSENTYDAFAGLNRFLQDARGKYVILCHQDILLHDHTVRDLEIRIAEIDSIDPNWAVLGNAGGINLKYLAMHLTRNTGNRLIEKHLPLRAMTVDENFILVKRSANLALSADLSGFHMYGTDITLIADTLGYSTYIIDFNLTHKSDGNADASFYALRRQLKAKYRRATRPKFISTTITRFYLSGNRTGFFLNNTGIVLFLVRQFYKFFRPKKGYCVKNSTG